MVVVIDGEGGELRRAVERLEEVDYDVWDILYLGIIETTLRIIKNS